MKVSHQAARIRRRSAAPITASSAAYTRLGTTGMVSAETTSSGRAKYARQSDTQLTDDGEGREGVHHGREAIGPAVVQGARRHRPQLLRLLAHPRSILRSHLPDDTHTALLSLS